MITIKTKLNSGIYQSEGGGEVRTHYSFNTNPRNLLKACKLLGEHKNSMKNGYGNIGCGRSWLEVDDQCIHEFDINTVVRNDKELSDRFTPKSLIKSGTQKATELLEEISAGDYAEKYNY
ncbi:hypothetical protein [Shewanella decolorationis]|uniref:hypothetical protein n=1 Tax=Shewanella decolorationis TaxID=256839 RepID=UPI00105716C5|nr:hypothetical protein [Shewanella decolorationis]